MSAGARKCILQVCIYCSEEAFLWSPGCIQLQVPIRRAAGGGESLAGLHSAHSAHATKDETRERRVAGLRSELMMKRTVPRGRGWELICLQGWLRVEQPLTTIGTHIGVHSSPPVQPMISLLGEISCCFDFVGIQMELFLIHVYCLKFCNTIFVVSCRGRNFGGTNFPPLFPTTSTKVKKAW